jgi:biopolymer transport protein ExbD/biopolymer transport protein TolR
VAFSTGNGSGRRGRRVGAIAEINIVPLVDVVLVLLVIFMLTAHVMEFGLEVEVPKIRAQEGSSEELPVVTMTKDGNLYLGEKMVNINRLGEEVKQRFPGAKGVYVRADGKAVWEGLAQVVAALGEAKLDVRMVTQPDETAGGGRRRR